MLELDSQSTNSCDSLRSSTPGLIASVLDTGRLPVTLDDVKPCMGTIGAASENCGIRERSDDGCIAALGVAVSVSHGDIEAGFW